MSVNRFIEPNKWSSEANKMRGNTDEARSINSYLDILKGKVYDAQKELIHNNTPVNLDTIKNKVIGVEQRARMLVPIFQEHNDKVETLVGQEFAPGTLERYKTSLKHTIEFIHWKYSVLDIDIKDIDHAFITEYEFFLRSVRKCANNTAVKYIKNFKKIVKTLYFKRMVR
jgi:Phage integrase SAM-like domain